MCFTSKHVPPASQVGDPTMPTLLRTPLSTSAHPPASMLRAAMRSTTLAARTLNGRAAASRPAFGGALPGAGARRLRAVASAAAAAAPLVAPDAAQLAAWRSALQLHNSMSRGKERFECRPGNEGKVSMYVCGVTVYDYSHIGEIRWLYSFVFLHCLQSADMKCVACNYMLSCTQIFPVTPSPHASALRHSACS